MAQAPFAREGVRGFLHPGSGRGALVLTHGAGSNAEARLLVAVASSFAEAGVTVLRCDLAFRIVRPKGPPSPAGAAADREGLSVAMAAMRDLAKGPYYLGGHSYGGRQASILAADDASIADAVLLLSYPLHPPKQPTRLRTDHFARLRTRCVFVHGTKDGFATGQELADAVDQIEAPTRIVTIEGAGHDLKGGTFDPLGMIRALIHPPASA